MLQRSGGGIQVADSSGAALAEGIKRLAETPSIERKRMGASGYEWVKREHGRDVLGARLDAFLRELLTQL